MWCGVVGFCLSYIATQLIIIESFCALAVSFLTEYDVSVALARTRHETIMHAMHRLQMIISFIVFRFFL